MKVYVKTMLLADLDFPVAFLTLCNESEDLR